ncbi:MAG: zinc ribbon domain-containing protein [Oscillospiraceae bacterium]|nr:zinc ribbon domain-containing protein [Oscillospiraceae bacterium]
MKCSNCGYEKNKEGKKFCIKCGKPLVAEEKVSAVLPVELIEDVLTVTSDNVELLHDEKIKSDKTICPNCGYEKNKKDRKFCIKCGKPFTYTDAKENVTLQFESVINDEEDTVSVQIEESTEEIIIPEQAEDIPEETAEEIIIPEQIEDISEETAEEIIVPEQVEDDITEKATVDEKTTEVLEKQRNPYLKYVIALIVILLVIGGIIIALMRDNEETTEINNAEITTASETEYEVDSIETIVTKVFETTVPTTAETTTVSETTVPTTAETTTVSETTVPTTEETTTVSETTVPTTAETTASTTTVPTTAATTVPKTETTVKTTITAVKNENEPPERELITPLDEVPEYEIYKLGGYYDEFEYKFVLDKSVLGEWEAFDKWEGDPSEYVYNKETASPDLGCFRNVIFYNDGTAITSGTSEEVPWTLGYVYTDMTKSGKKLKYRLSDYQLWIIDGEEYLFCKAKSHSNYADTGKTDRYSVFKRVSGEIPKPEETTTTTVTTTTTTVTTTTATTTTTSDIARELITPLDQVPEYQRVSAGSGYRDVLSYEFILDETVLGEWEAIDFISGDFSEYDPGEIYFDGQLFLRSLTFNDDGTLIWHTSETVTTEWTIGLVYCGFNHDMISSYELWNIEGEEYLFYEWKSGDYSIRGRTDCPYYVLKRKK